MASSVKCPVSKAPRPPGASRWMQRGATLVESAFVLPMFLVLLLGILDGGRLVFAYSVISHASREGARYLVVRGAEAALDARRTGDAPSSASKVETYVKSRAPISPIRVTVNWPGASSGGPDMKAGDFVEVRVEYEFNPVTPGLTNFTAKTISSTSRMLVFF